MDGAAIGLVNWRLDTTGRASLCSCVVCVSVCVPPRILYCLIACLCTCYVAHVHGQVNVHGLHYICVL